ncbi:MAG: tRNA (adenosine(37)-N6)-dimethylallyltransferase MiaA [Acidobacteriota bacterium]|nr:tRNA (adenosine(37)-N6)-dimethylallyltransferase MiaA [Acidobacteriota bacterium]
MPLIAIAGPTGSGKSALALRVAEEFNGEVVNCDSVQIYRGFDIGTAKLPLAERRGIPHHLIDIAEPDEVFTAGEFARRGRQVLADIAARGRVPVVSGGTGFYLRALIDGLSPGPARDPLLRIRLARREERRHGSLHRLLRRLDPSSAARIHHRDIPKTMRALEIRLLTGTPASHLFREGREPLEGFQIVKIGLFPPRQLLYERLNLRCEYMFQDGLMNEAENLLKIGVPPDAKPFQSLGYSQALQVMGGELTLPEAIDAAKQATRRYAKRQTTWFRKEADLPRFDGFGDDEAIQAAVVRVVRSAIAQD